MFDRLQYLKLRGEVWSIYHVNDVNVYLGREGGGRSPIERTTLRPFLVISVPSAGVLSVK